MPYTIQGQKPPLPRDPVDMDGVTYIPVRDIAEILGGSVERGSDTSAACVYIEPWSATVTVGANTAVVNGRSVSFSGPLVDEDGSLWAPADFFRAAFGYEVGVRGLDVSITNPNVPE